MTGTSEEVAAVLLAAGAGSRFGGERGAKLLADFRGRPLVVYAMETLAGSPVEKVFVVVEDASGEVASLARSFGSERCEFVVVENRASDKGQATSVEAGLGAVREAGGFGGLLVALGDQPLVGGEVVARLVEAFRDGARVAVATYSGRRRNPVLFSREVWEELGEGLRGDEGARGFLKSRRELVLEVECGDVGSAADVDTKDDLEALERTNAGAGYRKKVL